MEKIFSLYGQVLLDILFWLLIYADNLHDVILLKYFEHGGISIYAGI